MSLGVGVCVLVKCRRGGVEVPRILICIILNAGTKALRLRICGKQKIKTKKCKREPEKSHSLKFGPEIANVKLLRWCPRTKY